MLEHAINLLLVLDSNSDFLQARDDLVFGQTLRSLDLCPKLVELIFANIAIPIGIHITEELNGAKASTRCLLEGFDKFMSFDHAIFVEIKHVKDLIDQNQRLLVKLVIWRLKDAFAFSLD